MAFDIEQYKNEDSMEFEEAVEAVGNGRFHLRMVSVGGLALLCSYIAISGISFVLPASQCDLHMDSIDKGNLISAGFLGLILSCHMWGFLSDRLGRHYIIIRSLFFDGLLYIITSLTPYYRVILILRFFNGIASSGGIVSLYAYVGEFYTSKARTKALMIMSLIGCGSYFILPVVAWGILTSKWSFVLYPGFTFKPWRLYYAILGLPSLSCCFLLYFLPESPKFLLAKGDKKHAIKVFEKIYNENNNIKNHQQQFFIKNVTISDSEKLTKVDDNANKIVAFFSLLWDQTAPLFKRPHRFCMVLVCVTQYLLYMSFGGVYLWLPETMNRLAIFKEENVNQPATYCQVVQYSTNHDLSNNLTEMNTILKTLNNSILNNYVKYNNNNNNIANGEACSDSIDFSVYVNLEILGILQATACVVVLILIKYFDKRYVICCCIFSSFCAILCLLYLKIIEVIPLLANMVVILTGVTIPTLNSAVVDLFPTNLRAMASCLILMFSRIGTVTTNTLAGSLIDLHCSLLLWIFVVSFIVCFILVILLPKKPPYLEEEKNKINERF